MSYRPWTKLSSSLAVSTHVDDICIIWPHSPHELNNINNIHPTIQFIKQQEGGGHMPFLDTDIYSSVGGSLGQRVYRKPTHKDQYLKATSHRHLGQQLSAISNQTGLTSSHMKPTCTWNWLTSEVLPGRIFIPLHRFTESFGPREDQGRHTTS
jgi:hypothetical protein